MGKKKDSIILLDNGASVGAALAAKAAGEVPPPELPNDAGVTEQAVLKAELSRKAFEAIMQAGNGLVAAANDCEYNTPKASTLYVLTVVQGYVVDAMSALLERENAGVIGI